MTEDAQIGLVPPPCSVNSFVEKWIAEGNIYELETLLERSFCDKSSFFCSPVLHEISTKLHRVQDDQSVKRLTLAMLEIMRAHTINLDDVDMLIREQLSRVLEAEKAFSEAARCISQLSMENYSDDVKVSKYVQIAELFLRDKDLESAEAFCTRAGLVMHQVHDADLKWRYGLCHARINDYRGFFPSASLKYYDASLAHPQSPLSVELLSNACTCAILASAGPQRTRLLATLIKDERINRVSSFSVLEQMFLERIIKSEQIKQFAKSLLPHQLAVLPDARMTVLDKAILEHNTIAASKVYLNMYLNNFSILLDADLAEAEPVAAELIRGNRLNGFIDQMNGTIHFAVDKQEDDADETVIANRRIASLCAKINAVIQE